MPCTSAGAHCTQEHIHNRNSLCLTQEWHLEGALCNTRNRLRVHAESVAFPVSSPVLAQEYYLEGAFRNIHSRLRTHAESVAFFGGGEREGATISASFHALMQHLSAVIDIRRAHQSRKLCKPLCEINRAPSAQLLSSCEFGRFPLAATVL